MGDITLAVTLTPQQAQALLPHLRNHFQLLMTEAWFDLKYRHVPEGLRRQRIFNDQPKLAALQRINTALTSHVEPRS